MTDALDAGALGAWLDAVGPALRGEGESDVPCGTCTACCRSSQFVHVAPDESDALAHIPPELLFPAPGHPRGHVLLGYDDDGCCPMLVDGACTVYDHRPRACRAYDCRVYAAAGLDPAEDGRERVAERTRRWRFALPGPEDRERLAAVRAAVTFLQQHPEAWPSGRVPGVTSVAVAAVARHEQFLPGGDQGT